MLKIFEVIDKEALTTDDELLKEITIAEDVSEPTGIVLISDNESCPYCGSQLQQIATLLQRNVRVTQNHTHALCTDNLQKVVSVWAKV